MEDLKISLVDWAPDSGLGDVLKSILHSYSQSPIQVLKEPAGVHDLSRKMDRFSGHFRGDLIFLVLPADRVKQARVFLQSLRKRGGKIQVLAVVEGGGPEEAIELLKLGVADFLTPPLKSGDVLARIWRILEKKNPEEILLQHLKEKIGSKAKETISTIKGSKTEEVEELKQRIAQLEERLKGLEGKEGA